jgi:hypothetical protein
VKKDCTSNWYAFIVDLEMTEIFKHLNNVDDKFSQFANFQGSIMVDHILEIP